MAYTKIHAIKSTVEKAIAYIVNPDKTEEHLLVSSFACSFDTAYLEFEQTRKRNNYRSENLAYHCIQSFKEGEVSPDQAHMIGIQTADELLKGKYEYVVATHIDRGHIHNHILINGCNFESGLAFGYEHNRKNNPAWKQLREISDEICIENKLSVIAMPEKGYGKCYYEWLQDQKNNSYKSRLKNTIDRCIMSADSFNDFLEKMKAEGYEYKLRGNTLSFRADGETRFTRCNRKRLGWYYEPEQIRKRVDRQVRKRSSVLTKDSGFYEVHDDNAVGLNRWAALRNMQEASRLLNSLSDYGVSSVEELEEAISEKYDQRFDIMEELNNSETKIREQRELLKMLNTYWETKTVHDEYLKSGSKASFREEHSRQLAVFNATKEWLREKYSGTTLPNRSVLEMKINEDEADREAMLERYHDIKQSIKELESVKEKMDKFFEIDEQEQDIKKSNGELE